MKITCLCKGEHLTVEINDDDVSFIMTRKGNPQKWKIKGYVADMLFSKEDAKKLAQFLLNQPAE